MTGVIRQFSECGAGWIGRLALISTLAVVSVPTTATAQEYMSEKDLLTTIPGSTINAKSNDGTPWVQAYSGYKGGKKKGIIKGIFGDTKFDAKWFVQDGQWCENWGDGQACWQVERVDAKSLRMYENGKPKKNLWKLK